MEREKNILLYLPEIPWGSLLGLSMAEDALMSFWGTHDPQSPTHWERNRGLLNYLLRQMPPIVLLTVLNTQRLKTALYPFSHPGSEDLKSPTIAVELYIFPSILIFCFMYFGVCW